MRALKVELEAPVCSFRYPHFLVGRQLTFPMPPPSTIYGHVSSALGTLPEPTRFRFAYRFRSTARAHDLEHQQIIARGGAPFSLEDEKYKTSVQGGVMPTPREFLFDVWMELYIVADDLDPFRRAFHSPAFPVVLGRSQDLACYRRSTVMELERSERGYYEDTLLPFSFRERMGRGTTLLMPRYIEPPPLRQAVFDQFIALTGRILSPGPNEDVEPGADVLMRNGQESEQLWIDPGTEEWRGARRVLAFHAFTSEQESAVL